MPRLLPCPRLQPLGVRFTEVDIVGPKRKWRALVVSPTAHFALGRPRLEELRRERSPGELDREILARVRAGGDQLHLVIFRAGADDESASWGFSDDLDEAEAHELAYLLTASQVPTYRRFLAAGLLAVIHVEFEPTLLAMFKDAARRLESELATPAEQLDEDGLIASADRWILKNLTFHFGSSLDAAINRVLPDKLGLLDAGVRRMRELVGSLPAHALD